MLQVIRVVRSSRIFFSGFNFTTATINHFFIPFSTVQIYDHSYIHFYYMEESVLLGTKPPRRFHTPLHPGPEWRIFRMSPALTREILFLPLEHKIHIFSPPCKILYVSSPSMGVYYKLRTWSAPSELVSSIGRALHRYRWDYEFKSWSNLNFFSVLNNFTVALDLYITAIINHALISFSTVEIYDLSFIQL